MFLFLSLSRLFFIWGDFFLFGVTFFRWCDFFVCGATFFIWRDFFYLARLFFIRRDFFYLARLFLFARLFFIWRDFFRCCSFEDRFLIAGSNTCVLQYLSNMAEEIAVEVENELEKASI